MRLSVLLSPDITTRSITACFQFHCWTAASQIQQRKYFFISNYCIKRITGKLTNVKKTEGRKSCTVWVTVEEDERNVFENVTQEHNSMSPVWFCQNDSEQQTVFVYKKISCWCFRSNVFTEKGRREFLVSNESDYWWNQYSRKYVIFSPLTDVETCWNIQGWRNTRGILLIWTSVQPKKGWISQILCPETAVRGSEWTCEDETCKHFKIHFFWILKGLHQRFTKTIRI